MQLRLSVRTWHRLDAEWSDDDLGNRLVRSVRRAIDGGPVGAAALAIRADRIDLFDLGAVTRAGARPDVFLAGLTRLEVEHTGPVQAVGIMGRLQARSGPDAPGVPLATVFLEWPDCRWWQWKALFDPRDGGLREDTVTVVRAIDGAARPRGLGGWWTTGRRRRLAGRLTPVEPVMVH